MKTASCLVHHFLERSAEFFPDKLAIVHERSRAGYFEVSRWANQLAYHLIKAGVGRLMVIPPRPGGVATNFGRNNGLTYWLKHRLYYLMKRELLTPAQGAETIVYLASSDEVEGIAGTFFKDKKEKKPSDMSHDRTLQE